MKENNKRDMKQEYNRQKEINKRYVVKVPLYMSKALDEKLRKERKNILKYSNWGNRKIFKKIIKIL